jgi:cytochrome b pre-mRNA-processing protein 3
MIFSRFRRGASPGTISSLYGMIVAQARRATFYRDYCIADTVNGRFELLVLHLALVLERLAADERSKELGQGLFDLFCQDMDHNLREMGVGDLKVPAEMRRMGEAYYGRAQAYRAALSASDSHALVEVVLRNVYDGTGKAAAERLAAYIRVVWAGLQGQDGLAAGRLSFPDPAFIPG